MKRRVAPILTFTIALVLVGSLAYAAKKKIQAKSVPQTPEISEEETFKAELLNATEDREDKLGAASSKKIVTATVYENTKDQIDTQPKK